MYKYARIYKYAFASVRNMIKVRKGTRYAPGKLIDKTLFNPPAKARPYNIQMLSTGIVRTKSSLTLGFS